MIARNVKGIVIRDINLRVHGIFHIHFTFQVVASQAACILHHMYFRVLHIYIHIHMLHISIGYDS